MIESALHAALYCRGINRRPNRCPPGTGYAPSPGRLATKVVGVWKEIASGAKPDRNYSAESAKVAPRPQAPSHGLRFQRRRSNRRLRDRLSSCDDLQWASIVKTNSNAKGFVASAGTAVGPKSMERTRSVVQSPNGIAVDSHTPVPAATAALRAVRASPEPASLAR
jgi:hypothetical protein